MKSSLHKILFLSILPISLLIAETPNVPTQLDFSSLVDDFMEEGNVLKKTINLSGKQRMLSQYMAKLTAQISLNIQKDQSIVELKKISELYAKTLKAFSVGDSDLGIKSATNAKVKEQIKVLEKEWKNFEEQIQLIISKKDKDAKALAYVLENNEKLLASSNELVARYEASNTSVNYLEKARLRVVNVAGRQRMLIEKMTKEKLLCVKSPQKYNSKLKSTVKLFNDSLTTIIKGDSSKQITKPSNPKIIKQLKVISKLWEELKPLYKKEKNSSKELAIIIAKNSTLLKEMNTMVELAEKEVEY